MNMNMRSYRVGTYCEISRKRKRDANWNPEETRILLEQMRAEGSLLFSKQKNDSVNKKKQQAWERISSRVSSCGMALAERDIVSCKERWAKLRNKVRSRRLQAETKDGVVVEVPFEDLILQLMGTETALVDATSIDSFNGKMKKEVESITTGYQLIPGTVTSIDSFNGKMKKEVESITTGYQLIPGTDQSVSMRLKPLQTPVSWDVSHTNGRDPARMNGTVLTPHSRDLNLSAVKIELDEMDGSDIGRESFAVASDLLGGFQDDSSQQDHVWSSSSSFTHPSQSASLLTPSSSAQYSAPFTSRPQSAPPAQGALLSDVLPQSSSAPLPKSSTPAADTWDSLTCVPRPLPIPLQSSGLRLLGGQRHSGLMMKHRSCDVKDALFDEYLSTEIKKNKKMIQWMASEIARNNAQQKVAELKALKLRRELEAGSSKT